MSAANFQAGQAQVINDLLRDLWTIGLKLALKRSSLIGNRL
jgi:hypothetical protein